MNTVDIINKLSVTHGLSSGRAEMILSIIFEKITERLKKDSKISINGFGEFYITDKNRNLNSDSLSNRKIIGFNADKYFLDKINS